MIDDGPGIDPDEAAHLFERFYRSPEARARDRDGSGLGLAIAQAIVDAHGGRIWADPDYKGGARLVVELPGYGRRKQWPGHDTVTAGPEHQPRASVRRKPAPRDSWAAPRTTKARQQESSSPEPPTHPRGSPAARSCARGRIRLPSPARSGLRPRGPCVTQPDERGNADRGQAAEDEQAPDVGLLAQVLGREDQVQCPGRANAAATTFRRVAVCMSSPFGRRRRRRLEDRWRRRETEDDGEKALIRAQRPQQRLVVEPLERDVRHRDHTEVATGHRRMTVRSHLRRRGAGSR